MCVTYYAPIRRPPWHLNWRRNFECSIFFSSKVFYLMAGYNLYIYEANKYRFVVWLNSSGENLLSLPQFMHIYLTCIIRRSLRIKGLTWFYIMLTKLLLSVDHKFPSFVCLPSIFFRIPHLSYICIWLIFFPLCNVDTVTIYILVKICKSSDHTQIQKIYSDEDLD